jgi:S1-C subfamily serine protease
MSRYLRPFLMLLAAAVAGAVIAAVIFSGRSTHTTTVIRERVVDPSPALTTVGSKGETPAQIYQEDAPGVVVVKSIIPGGTNSLGFPQGSEEALGSGFVIDRDGHILTNAHVVQGATKVTVGFSSASGLDNTYPAKVLGLDKATDVAVLEPQNLPANAIHPLPMGSVRDVSVGDPVVAIGNPLGEERTITSGIISAVNRTIDSLQTKHPIQGALQTDAAINHGNSGGPLIDSQGKVIGITSQILSDGPDSGNIGIGFAIPINTALTVAHQLIANGHAEHTYLGIKGQPLNLQLAKAFNIPTNHGVLVETVVPNSPAAKAGLRGGTTSATIDGMPYILGGDVITAVNGKPIIQFADLLDAISSKKPGQTVTLTILRDGKQLTVSATLGADD